MQIFSKQLDTVYSIQLYDSIQHIGVTRWNAIQVSAPFYQSYEFLESIEKIQEDTGFRYVLVMKEQQVVAALYVQLLEFSFRNLVNYSGDTAGGIKGRFKRYMAGKNTRLMNLGNVFFTGDRGILCSNEDEIIPFVPQIFKYIHQSFVTNKPSAFLIANIYLKDESKCIDFCNSAFHPFVTEPDMFMPIREEWHTFEDYMNALSSKYRVRAKKVLTTSAPIQKEVLSLADIMAKKDQLAKLYNNVVNHVAFNMATLNIDFFETMKRLYGERVAILGYYLNHELIGFACLFNVEETTLHVHYIGLNYDVNLEYKLYNRMLLDFVRFAIEHKKQHVHFGRTATEIKTTIGAQPQPLQAYLKMNNRWVNASLPYFLKRIKPAEYTVRNPFKETIATGS